jgi:superfamily II RNA helicase
MVIVCNDSFNDDANYNDYFNYFNKFELSDFQKWAIKAIVDKEHILITAHTGSGKTLPAEFAIQYYVSQGKKVIYTAPIKALSNTKLYDLRNKYPHISFGIITGDITDNPDADVLIMTTEILPHTLNNRKLKEKTNIDVKLNFEIDIDTELAAVVFDEIHYINDPERGNVWEQAILLLPPHIQLIMLSATIDKPQIFAQWIENKKKQQSEAINTIPKNVYLTSTNHRVVPLTHYLWLTCHKSTLKKAKNTEYEHLLHNFTNKEIIIKDEKNNFKNKNYENLVKINKYFKLSNTPYSSRQFVLNTLITHLKKTDGLPAICFVFSRKNVEKAANEINFSLFEDDSIIPNTIENECKKIIMSKFTNYKEYLELPEYTNLIKLLQKGIGYHHAGVLAVFREMIEILFDRKLIKILFATETLAVGVNFSTTSVIYTGITKFDGNGMRLLAPHEYTQIAGRAGRRGIDKVGKVWLCCNLFKPPPLYEFEHMLSGKPQTLISKFKISFSMCLNIISSDDSTLETILDFANQSLINNDIDKELKYYEKTINDIDIQIKSKEGLLQNIRTQKSILDEYVSKINEIKISNNKKKKRLHREICNIEENNIYIKEEIKIIEDIEFYKNEKEKNNNFKNNTVHYLEEKIKNSINLLIHSNFIDKDFKITQTGCIARQFNEIHPLILSTIIYETNYFYQYDVSEIIGILSIFTTINVDESIKIVKPCTKSDLVNTISNKINDLMNKFYDLEQKYNTYSGSNYERNFDIQNSVIEWTNTTNELDCKIILQTISDEQNIFIGDFVKALLKINNIANELERVAESTNNMVLLEKIKTIPQKTLKYIATNQSLYI